MNVCVFFTVHRSNRKKAHWFLFIVVKKDNLKWEKKKSASLNWVCAVNLVSQNNEMSYLRSCVSTHSVWQLLCVNETPNRRRKKTHENEKNQASNHSNSICWGLLKQNETKPEMKDIAQLRTHAWIHFGSCANQFLSTSLSFLLISFSLDVPSIDSIEISFFTISIRAHSHAYNHYLCGCCRALASYSVTVQQDSISIEIISITQTQ